MYWRLIDPYTKEELIPFDDVGTKLSADGEGMYFDLYMNGLEPERFYKILIKTNINEEVLVFDNNYYS